RMKDIFPKVAPSKKEVDEDTLIIADGARLGRFRKHLLAVCELNRETWKFIRAETDDDHEWLPNPKQKGVIGLPVRDQMIGGWLAMIDQLEELLRGKRLFPACPLFLVGVDPKGKGLNAKPRLDAPPMRISEKNLRANGLDA